MSKIIACVNEKGGVAKTTTIKNLAIGLAARGKKVLAIDLDPSANLTTALGIHVTKEQKTILDIFKLSKDCEDVPEGYAIMQHEEGIDVICSVKELHAFESELICAIQREIVLRRYLISIKDDYDYIIIDCPPSLNMLTINSMTTADSVLVPIQCEYYALEGLSQLIHTINLVKERLNPDLRIDGVVFTMYDSRTNLSMQVVENVKQNLNQKVYNTLIPRNIRLAEAPSYGMPINMYDPKSAGAEAYMQLAEEVIKNK